MHLRANRCPSQRSPAGAKPYVAPSSAGNARRSLPAGHHPSGPSAPAPRSRGRRIQPNVASKELQSEAERFVEALEVEVTDGEEDDAALEAAQQAQLQDQLTALRSEEARLSTAIDELYDNAFRGLRVEVPYADAAEAAADAADAADVAAAAAAAAAPADAERAAVALEGAWAAAEAIEGRGLEVLCFDRVGEAQFSALGRERPAAAAALMAAAEAAAPEAWRAFQSQVRAAGSLPFDCEQVEWLRARLDRVPVRLVFESALELMSYNKGGTSNVVAMFSYLVERLLAPTGTEAGGEKTRHGYGTVWQRVGPKAGYVPPPVVETPPLGCLHPLAPAGTFFASPADYMRWYDKHGPLRGTDAPVVAVLLYRKHAQHVARASNFAGRELVVLHGGSLLPLAEVITDQPYIGQLVLQLEAEGLLPLPVFINGVEAHTVVRDLLTSSHEQGMLARGETGGISTTLRRDAVRAQPGLHRAAEPQGAQKKKPCV
ncbi:hypothetical protein TSOC_008607 [Tetrabaena socialis]|uniref:Uncharacterized protein n=1 Tax=Tetrabaena socialis TaxID=47790 RepID=A0A2J7ZY20_9CHLO|nr:hypothetical protein TSOC_008607 [Tetrabaena socialis]|eukprot:PNH05157.1 hypothetical protein TSOC_008607 [Tetrabaena socialis]